MFQRHTKQQRRESKNGKEEGWRVWKKKIDFVHWNLVKINK